MGFSFDEWMEKQSVGRKPLSDRRERQAQEMASYRGTMERIAEKGICFSINPTDINIHKLGEQGIKNIVQRAMDRHNSMYMLIPEYNTQRHQLHYHGCALIKDYETLTKIKRSIVRQVGRTESEAMESVTNWVNYCFKSYEDSQPSHIETIWNAKNIIIPKGLNISTKDIKNGNQIGTPNLI